jgi:hypothetical protein
MTWSLRRPYAPTDIYQEKSQSGEADRKYGRTIVVISVPAAALTGWLIGRNLPALAHLLDHHEGAVVGIATAVVALFTWALWRATMAIDEGARSTLDHLQTSSQQQLRAYICVEINGAEVIGPIPKSNVFELRPRVKNFGQTPAYDITVTVGADLLPFPSLEESDLPLVESPSSIGVLGPQQETTLYVHTPKTFTCHRTLKCGH